MNLKSMYIFMSFIFIAFVNGGTVNSNVNIESENVDVIAGNGSPKNPNFVPGTSGIVHLFEWKFSDIARECEIFLSKFGFGGVQVSPVNEYIIVENRPWYERYQPISYKLETRSGNEEQFRDMVKRCNKVGIRTYVDVVINHMSANSANPIGTGGSKADPSIKSYPAAGYNMSDFHDTCEIRDYRNPTEVRNCELVGLHDLNQGLPHVRTQIINFINHLINIGIAGIRVDAAKHMWPSDLKYIYSKLNNLNRTYFARNSRPFIYQEIIDMGGEAIQATEYTDFGRVTDFKYGAELGRLFKGNDKLKWLQNFGPAWGLQKSQDSIAFIDNHDNQRGSGGGGNVLTYKEAKQYKMAIAFMLAWPHSTPRIMSSFYFDNVEQGPPHNDDFTIKDVEYNDDLTCRNGWVCEHRWRQIYHMLGFHNVVEGTNVTNWWDNGNNQISFCRGKKGFAAFNQDSYPIQTRLQTCLPPGYYCDVISGYVKNHVCSGKVIQVDDSGFAYIHLGNNEDDGVLAIHTKSKMT